MADRTQLLSIEDAQGGELPVRLRFSGRARRVSLRVDPTLGGAELVVPDGVREATALAFLERNRGWLEAKLSRLPEPIPFQDGALVPLLGQDHRIHHMPNSRRGVWLEVDVDESPEIRVSGDPAYLPRRVGDWMRRHAKQELGHRARGFAQNLDRTVGRISVRDTRSRWGSCSSAGNLSFSWRLILAPEWVVDYVCAHEAAHLVEMNHSPRFWRLVEDLVEDVAAARTWLKRHGNALHRYG